VTQVKCQYMRRTVFLIGSMMLVVGFILYQFGLSSELYQTTLLRSWLADLSKPLITRGISLEAITILLEFGGGLLVIFGLIVCFEGAARPNYTTRPARPVEPTRNTSKCRFCGADVQEGSTFCPSCNKSQA
jgi:hypothetical protein